MATRKEYLIANTSFWQILQSKVLQNVSTVRYHNFTTYYREKTSEATSAQSPKYELFSWEYVILFYLV